jgi:antitoxin Phd
LLKTAIQEGPQVVTSGGVETAVVVPIEEWRRLQAAARPSVKDWLLAPTPRFDIPLPDRRKYRSRKPVDFE